MIRTPEAIEAGMEKIRAMIEKAHDAVIEAQTLPYPLGVLSKINMQAHLDCYSALGGDVSKWRDEKGNLK